MPSTFTIRLAAAAAAAAGALTLGAAEAHAQGYDDYGPTAGTVTVSPPETYRSWDGAPIQRVYASRVVQIGDLDLDSDWGRHALYDRVERAAVDACDEVNSAWTQGYYPIGVDEPCVSLTIRRAMRQVYGG